MEKCECLTIKIDLKFDKDSLLDLSKMIKYDWICVVLMILATTIKALWGKCKNNAYYI